MMAGKLTITTISPQFVVTDLERSINFYVEVLGFSVEFRHEDFYAGLSRGSFKLHLKLGDPAPEERNNKIANEHLDLVITVDDIQSVFEDLDRNYGSSIIQPLREMPYGFEFYMLDPDGYILGFME